MSRKRRKKINKERNPGLVVAGSPKSVIAEQFRTVRTNIQFSMVDRELKSLIVTSAESSSGKSTIAANLAATFATNEKRVLLVDADLRKPMLHQIFRLHNNDGLTSLLMQKKTEINDILYKTHTEGLYLITSGPIPPNPADLLTSKKMRKLLREMEDMFDLVIFDMPPVLPVTDAQVLGSKVDGALFVVPYASVTKEAALKSKELLELAEVNIIGAVMNRMEKDRSNYYYYSEEE